MMKNISVIMALLTITFSACIHASVITNGDFENGNFTNDNSNYDQLFAGDTSLTAWTIVNEVVWGMNPLDGFTASSGNAFIDLSSFGTRSPNGQIDQTISLIAGTEYLFSIDRQGANADVTIDGISLDLMSVGTNGNWTTYTGSYTAVASSAVLSLSNFSATNPVVFVDNLSMVALPAVEVSTAHTFILLILGLAGISVVSRVSKYR